MANPSAYKDVGTFFSDEAYNGLLYYIEHLPSDVVNYTNSFVPFKLKNRVKKQIDELRADNGLLHKEFT